MCATLRSLARSALLIALIWNPEVASAQTAATQQAAVRSSINYVFATDLGSGVYDFDGRTLQVYRLTYSKQLRESSADHVGVRFELPATVGFFDFNPLDVLSNGIPTRVDSISVVPGVELDYLLPEDWHLIPYLRAGFSMASSSVDGWLYGTGVRLERNGDFHGWDSLTRSELNISGVDYRNDHPNDRFVRLRQGFDLTRGLKWQVGGRQMELGIYAIFDVILDPPTAPVAEAGKQPIQAEFGFTLSTRPRFKIWRFDTPRLGFGYRLAGELSAWRFVIGVPF
jgi:hypothetical protein